MGLNLTIDQGNSSTKVAIFDGSEIVAKATYLPTITIAELDKLYNDYQITSAIYSSVRKDGAAIVQHLKGITPIWFQELSYTTNLPIKLLYKTPETLGYDRVAAAIGASEVKSGVNLLIIDAGTAITLDILTADGEYLGGNISPGVKMRFQALNHFTNKLPLIDVNGDIPAVGYDTETAIRSGVVGGVIAEIDGYIRENLIKFGDLTVFMTGGDSTFLVKQIKSCIFEDENLLMRGLNRIILHNIG
ncbi:MAG: type III pantothenate kinase [Bacteroidales bacterium]